MRIFTFLLTAVILLPSAAHAQTPPPPPPPVHEGSAEFAFVGTGGNSETQSIGLGAEVIYRPSPWETRFKATYVRNEAQDEVKAQAVTFTGRAQRSINSRLAGYGQYGYLRDRFAGILSRNIVEAGLSYSLLNQGLQKLNVDAGFGYANEQRLVGANPSTATVGAGGLYTLKLSATSDLSEDGHFLFSLSDSSDWRFANTAAVTARINTMFSLKASNALRYVRTPVARFKSTDFVTAIALVAKFSS